MKLEEGGESRAPLAVLLSGGVISSTLLTLVRVPSVYTILDDAKEGIGSLKRRLGRKGAEAAPAHGVPALQTISTSVVTPPPVRGGSED
jgi:hydrophobic/amphiphilic exporter-1 (mainly G- bacteria), HAE1 family